MSLLFTVLYHLNASEWWFLEMENELFFKRLVTPRPPTKVKLKSSWQTQQQQQQQLQDASGSASARSWKQSADIFGEGRDEKRIQATQQGSQKPLTTGNCCGSDVPNITHVEERPWILSRPQNWRNAHDVILKDEERMDQIQEVAEKWRTGSHTKSIREDLRKPENSMIFSEKSRRIIH